jgi:hypothetical protein
LIVLLLSFCSCGESCLLVSWCVDNRCDVAGSDKDRCRSRRPSAKERGWSSKGRVMPCAVYTVYIEKWSMSFLVEP